MKEQFGDILYKLRKEYGLTIDEFVEEINKRYPDAKLNKSMVSRYENNIHKPKRFTLVQQISEFYNVSPNYLMGLSNNKYGEEIKSTHKRIPVLGTIAAGQPILAQQYIEGYEYTDENEKIDFCLRVKGNSMINARIYDGDLVYIRQQMDVENGEIAAVIIDNNEATLKRVYKIDGNIILRSENPEFRDMIFSKKDMKDIRIIGKAIYFKSEVK